MVGEGGGQVDLGVRWGGGGGDGQGPHEGVATEAGGKAGGSSRSGLGQNKGLFFPEGRLDP